MPPSSDADIVRLSEDARRQFMALDGSVRERIKKRLEKLQTSHDVRTLKGHPDIWVLNIGDYRAFYLIDKNAKIKNIFFIGNHKEYQRLYEKMFGKR